MKSSSFRRTRSRAGITLTEILISILIMGIGMISLATLFPLGILRLRAAARNVRSALLTETAYSDVAARNLLVKSSFPGTWYTHDPMSQDPKNPVAPVFNTTLTNPFAADGGAFRSSSVPGLPFCYDPLWRQLAGVKPQTPSVAGAGSLPEARFASGINFLRTDPDGGMPSGHGLQRITNLPVGNQWGLAVVNTTTTAGAQTAAGWLQMTGDIFASQDDLVYQTAGATPNVFKGQGNPLSVDLSTKNPFTGLPTSMADWSYTWMFTGFQSEVGISDAQSKVPGGASDYSGNIVVYHNRSFGIENGVPAGETVVEAIWGYSTNTVPFIISPALTVLYPNGDNRQVLLRWPAGQPDPDVRLGGWIADVTYERTFNLDQGTNARFLGTPYSGQRCFWYRIARKTTPEAETKGYAGDPGPYRRMVVTLDSPVQAKTAVVASGDVNVVRPQHVECAFISPFVVNVFPVSINPR